MGLLDKVFNFTEILLENRRLRKKNYELQQENSNLKFAIDEYSDSKNWIEQPNGIVWDHDYLNYDFGKDYMA